MQALTNSINSLNESVDALARCTTKAKQLPLDRCDDTNDGFEAFLKSGSGPTYTKSMTSENGGLLIPQKTSIHIYDKMQWCSPIRALASRVKISTEALDILVDTKSVEAAWSSEEKFPDCKDPEFKKIQIPVHEVFSRVKATQKLLDDASVNIYDWFVSKIATQIAKVEDHAFINGDGNGKPKGILSYPTQVGSSEFGKFQHFITGHKGKFKEAGGADVLIRTAASLNREFTQKAAWLMSKSAFRQIQMLKEQGTGRYIWQPSLSASPSTLLGYPVFVDENMPELNGSNATNSIIFGDFSSAYQIVDRTDITVFRDPYSSKPFVEFYSTKRTGGDVINFDALRIVRFSE